MKFKINTLIMSLSLAMLFTSSFAQQASQSGQKIIDLMVGTWQISKVYEGKKELKSDADTTIQTMEFTREAKFISRTNQQKIDSGLFRINENHKILYLESSENKDAPPTEWSVSLKDNTLTLAGRGSPQAASFKYLYVRKSGAKSRK
jgi:ABC-type metal ion transport system substrate-binding protein